MEQKITYLERTVAAAELMYRVHKEERNFDMKQWSSQFAIEESKRNETGYKECGNAACFGGWLAVSSEFISAGGCAGVATGSPILVNLNNTLCNVLRGSDAISFYLGIPWSVACGLTYSSDHSQGRRFYGKAIQDVTALDVMEQLLIIANTKLAVLKNTA